jgi:hypothetical protein
VTSTGSAYRERLSVPAVWWLVSICCVAFGELEIIGGLKFRWDLAVAVGAILLGFFVVPLIVLGHALVEIRDGELRAGGKALPLNHVRNVTALDVAGTRRALGPAADPGAHVVLRGWVKTAVLVRVRGTGPTPYWLVSTRQPDALAAALRTGAAKPVATP